MATSPIYRWIVVGLLAVTTATSIADRFILVLFIGQIANDLHLSDTQIGLITGAAFSIFYSVFGLLLGRIADTYNRRNLIVFAIACWSLSTIGAGFAQSGTQLFLSRLGVAIGEAALIPTSYSIVSDLFSPRRLPRAMSFLYMGTAASPGLAMLIGGVLFQAFAVYGTFTLPLIGQSHIWQSVFIAAGAAGLILAPLFLFIVREPRRKLPADMDVHDTPNNREFLQFLWSKRRLYGPLFLGLAMISADFNAILTWSPVFYQRVHGWSPAETGTFLGISLSLCGLLGSYLGGGATKALTDRRGSDASLLAVLLFGAVCLPTVLFASLIDNSTFDVACLTISFVLFMALFSIVPSFLQLSAPNRMRGRLSAVYLLVITLIAPSVGPLMVGVVTDRLFGDQAMVGKSLALTGLATFPIGLVLCGLAYSWNRSRRIS